MEMVFLAIVWAFAGLVLGIPYTYLSDGQQYITEAVVFLPVAGLVLGFLWLIARVTHVRAVFLVPVAAVCMPILMNGAHHVLGWLGYAEASAFAYEYRFTALGMAIYGPVLLLIAYLIFLGIVDWARAKFSSPPASPPSSPSSVDEEQRTSESSFGGDDILQCVWTC
jgi:hypothetical protein